MKLTNTHKFFDRLLLFLLVMSGGSVFFKTYRNELSIFLFFLAVFILIFTGSRIKKSIFNASLLTLSFFSFLILINYIICPKIEIMGYQNPNFLQYGFHLLNITSSVLILIHLKNNRSDSYFLSTIHFILKVILYHALISFFAYFVIKSYLFGLYGGYENKYIADTFNYLFFYDLQKPGFSLLNINLVRNQGVFWEPGILQIFLNLLLFFKGFVFKKNNWTFILIIFAIITTYSTTGIFIMIILLILIFWKSIRSNPLLILLAISLFFPLYYIAKTNIENKTTGERSSSFQKRYLDLVEPIAIASDYPLTGIGLDRQYFQDFRMEYQIPDNFYLERVIKQSIDLERGANETEKGSSNSLTYLIASMGFPISVFLFYCLLKQELFMRKNGVFLIIIIISVFSEPLLLRPFFLILITSGMMSIFNKFIK